MFRSVLFLLVLCCSQQFASAFLASPSRPVATSDAFADVTRLYAKQKKRRRRKQPQQTGMEEVKSPPVAESAVPVAPPSEATSKTSKDEPVGEAGEAENVDLIKEIATFEFKPDPPIAPESAEPAAPEEGEQSIPLPDIRQALKKKRLEEDMARMEAEEEAKKPKIDRRDKDALKKLLEQQPYADADESFFEEEEYSVVNALLGERAKPFLGIPTGPLQVGHFIGALVIVLMAFIEYPGFPLTNLPSPIRGSLQGGLGIVYGINVVLAVLAVFQASERGQPVFLWVAKCFTVGGLAYDQLTQLPTKKQIEDSRKRKAARQGRQ